MDSFLGLHLFSVAQNSSALHFVLQELVLWHILKPPGTVSLQTGLEGEDLQSELEEHCSYKRINIHISSVYPIVTWLKTFVSPSTKFFIRTQTPRRWLTSLFSILFFFTEISARNCWAVRICSTSYYEQNLKIGDQIKALNLPILQILFSEQYCPTAQTRLHEVLLGLWQVFSPVLEDSLQTVLVFWL